MKKKKKKKNRFDVLSKYNTYVSTVLGLVEKSLVLFTYFTNKHIGLKLHSHNNTKVICVVNNCILLSICYYTLI
jgi:hypothetical protein